MVKKSSVVSVKTEKILEMDLLPRLLSIQGLQKDFDLFLDKRIIKMIKYGSLFDDNFAEEELLRYYSEQFLEKDFVSKDFFVIVLSRIFSAVREKIKKEIDDMEVITIQNNEKRKQQRFEKFIKFVRQYDCTQDDCYKRRIHEMQQICGSISANGKCVPASKRTVENIYNKAWLIYRKKDIMPDLSIEQRAMYAIRTIVTPDIALIIEECYKCRFPYTEKLLKQYLTPPK